MLRDIRLYSLVFVIILLVGGMLPTSMVKAESISIVGPSTLTSKQMGDYVLLNESDPKLMDISIYELAELYLEIGEIEGIRGDIAFAQAIHETGFFRFGGDVIPEQNNYSGIGTTGGGVKGAFFATPEEGVRAQIQHLKAYANKEPLNTELIDPRFNFVKRGIAPLWTDLNGRWAVPGRGYGEKILQFYSDMSNTTFTLAIPNVELPANHHLPVAKLIIKADVPMFTQDGVMSRNIKKGEKLGVYGVLGNSYDIGEGYLVEANSSKMSVYIGRVLIKDSEIPIYKPDGTIFRMAKHGEALMVYDYDDDAYQVGGGYYVKTSDKPIYHLGRIVFSEDTIMYSPDGTPYSTLKKGANYPVFGIDGDLLDMGGGYTVQYDKESMTYIN